MDDQDTLTTIRAFLEISWEKWKIERLRDLTVPLSTGMCRFSSIFLHPILEDRTGRSWKMVGGETRDGDVGGMMDSNGEWQPHYWLTDGNMIVDVTADQFGHDPIILTDYADPRYRANLTSLELRWHIADASITPAAWHRDFADFTPDDLIARSSPAAPC